MYYYFYNVDVDVISIEKNERLNLGACEDDYWCYVFMPDAPKIEKKKTLEERIERLELFLRAIAEENISLRKIMRDQSITTN